MPAADTAGDTSSTTSGSQSPSTPTSASSGRQSPASNALMLTRTDEGDAPDAHSPRPAPYPSRPHMDLMRPHAGGSGSRGGCWTCRLRRKKCDEQRVGDSCQTCIRLKIDCLGWGTRRPDWMRDKEAVAAYKSAIKAKLADAGMIRGIPRPSIAGTHPRMTPLTPQYDLPGAQGPGPPMVPDDPSVIDYYRNLQCNNLQYGHPHPSRASGGSSHAHHSAIPGYPSDHLALPHSPAPHVSVQIPPDQFFPVSDFVDRTTEGGPSNHNHSMISTSGATTPSQNSVVEQHIFYYFPSVLPVQYPFCSTPLTSVFHDLIVQEPLGAVTNASCALASLHNKSIRVSRGLEPPDHSTATTFYNRAFWQLANVSASANNKYTEADAVAALHLVNYWLFLGGLGDWSVALDIARDWLAQTGIANCDNPKLTYHSLSDAAKFAVKATMWLDIFSGITFGQEPRFLHLYRRLLGSGGGYWARGGMDLRMDMLMGCPDDVMLAFAETMALAQWKTQERNHGSLSVRELIRRGNDIEKRLRGHESRPATAAAVAAIDQTAGDGTLLTNTTPHSPRSTSSASVHTTSPYPAQPNLPPLNGSAGDFQRNVSDVFREAAVLYLHTVLSEPSPGVPEIKNAVTAAVNAIHSVAPSAADRGLVLPMFLVGCMTDQANHREFIKRRMMGIEDAQAFGNVANARVLMESVWHRRDTHRGTIVEWRDLMHDLGSSFLIA